MCGREPEPKGGRRESNASHAHVRWRRDRRIERGRRTKEDALLSEVTHRGHTEVAQRSRTDGVKRFSFTAAGRV